MQSESIKELAKALSNAQGAFEHAKKDATNPHFKSKYATLAGCIDAAKDALAKNGLTVIQTTELDGSSVVLVTTLAHESGEWIKGFYPVNPVKQDPQGYGSAMTYARRYAFSAITGIAADDDDGEAGSQKEEKKVKSPFSNAALRNKFHENVKSSLNEAESMDALNEIMALNKGKIDEMKDGGNEYDLLAIDDLRQAYRLRSNALNPKPGEERHE